MLLLIVIPIALMVFKKRGRSCIGQTSYRRNHKKIKWTLDDYKNYWESRFIYVDEFENYCPDSMDIIPTQTLNTPQLLRPPKNVTKKKRSEHEWRWVIAFFYEEILLSPPREEWKGNGGTISEIIKLLNMSKGSRKVVENVLLECEAAERRGDSPNFDQKKRAFGPKQKN